MALVPGSLQVDIFVTNIPNDPKPMTPAGTDTERQKSSPQSGSKFHHSWTPTEYPPTLHTPQMSQSLTSMEDIYLCSETPVPAYIVSPEEKSRRSRSRISLGDYYNTLLMPNPYIGPSSGRYCDGGLKGKGYEYEMGHHQDDSTYDVLDYTHFNGDLDAEVIPAEESLNKRLKREGVSRRKKTRSLATGSLSRDSSVRSPTSGISTAEYTKSSPLSTLRGHRSGRRRGHSQSLTLDVSEETLTGKRARRTSIPLYLQQYELGLSQQDFSKSSDKRANRTSIRNSLVDVAAVQSMMPKTGKGARGEEMEIQFSEAELEDVLVMAEYAWPGHPMLDKLLQEEVEMAKGATVVACRCSPPFFVLFDSDLGLPTVYFS